MISATEPRPFAGTPPVEPGDDLTDPDIYARGVPLEAFVWLRRTAPVFWNCQDEETSGFDDGGLWMLSRYMDLKAVSCAREGWSSEENTAIVRFDGATVGYQQREVQKQMMLNMDEPRHARLRGVVSRGVFTPLAIARLTDALRERAERIVPAARDAGTGDCVTDIVCELPLQAIAYLVGFPQEGRKRVFDWSNEMMACDDPDSDVDPADAAAQILGYASGLGDQRAAETRDDIISRLVAAADGDVLDSEEFAFFVLLLAVAGNETTRNAISHRMQAFFDAPEQWERYKAERPPTTADEVVRFGTPVQMFQRTATADTVVGGQVIRRGQRVDLLYGSANYDETVFDEPNRFDIGRSPNHHVGFGGGGVHYCPGAHLARLEIDLLLGAMADHLPDIRPAGPQRRLRWGWRNGINAMPVTHR